MEEGEKRGRNTKFTDLQNIAEDGQIHGQSPDEKRHNKNRRTPKVHEATEDTMSGKREKKVVNRSLSPTRPELGLCPSPSGRKRRAASFGSKTPLLEVATDTSSEGSTPLPDNAVGVNVRVDRKTRHRFLAEASTSTTSSLSTAKPKKDSEEEKRVLQISAEDNKALKQLENELNFGFYSGSLSSTDSEVDIDQVFQARDIKKRSCEVSSFENFSYVSSPA